MCVSVHKIKKIVACLVVLFIGTSFSQHRGDRLAFQGIANSDNASVKALAMGNAYTSMSGDLSCFHFNPAGLAAIDRFAVSVSGSHFNKKWHENQEYRPNRFFITLPFYLEGLYVPGELNYDPETGEPRWDNEIAQDSAYIVNLPKLGLDSFSEDAADWINEQQKNVLNTVKVAFPFQFLSKQFVVGAGYRNRYNVLDYDRNDTYLHPHIGYTGYDMPLRIVEGDTINIDWYRFARQRTGNLHQGRVALGLQVDKKLNLGLALNVLSGTTKDEYSLDKYGYFELIDQNVFRFGFDSLDTRISGESAFSSMSLDLGFNYNFERFALGINVTLPHTLTREWEYTRLIADTTGVQEKTFNGTDTFDQPFILNAGFHVRPFDQLVFSFDYSGINYSQSEFSFDDTATDTTHNKWVDQNILKAGMEYKIASFLSLMVGYQYAPQIFVPDGAAFNARGPVAVSYSGGLSIRLFQFGRIDLAYERQRLEYYDQYISNTNYNVIRHDNLSAGYTHYF